MSLMAIFTFGAELSSPLILALEKSQYMGAKLCYSDFPDGHTSLEFRA